MSQELYVVDLITKYSSFLDATVTRTFDTPMEEGLVLSAADQPEVGSEAADGLIPGHGHRWRRTGRHGGHEIVKPFVYREPQVAAKTRDQVFVVQQLPRATEARGAVRAITPGVSSVYTFYRTIPLPAVVLVTSRVYRSKYGSLNMPKGPTPFRRSQIMQSTELPIFSPSPSTWPF